MMKIGNLKIEIEKKSTKVDKFLENIKNAIEHGGMEAAKEVCRNTVGHVAYASHCLIEMFQEEYKK